LLFILTVSADGAVPIAYRATDGNISDDLTHIPTWDELARLVGRPDFLYVADSKLCSSEAMGHIAARKGRFVTVVPHGRKEDTFFRDWARLTLRPGKMPSAAREIALVTRPGVADLRGAGAVNGRLPGDLGTFQRQGSPRLRHSLGSHRGRAGGDRCLQSRIESPKSRLKTRVAVEQATTAALAEARAAATSSSL